MSILQKVKHFGYHSALLWKNRRTLPAVAEGYFRTLALGQTVLRTLELTVTPDCNVECEMCYATKIKDKSRQPLTPAEYGALWRQAKRLGAFSIIISGGEPTLRKDLFDILSQLEPGKSMIALVSNSTLLDRAYLERLWANGVTILHMSLNSVNPEVNDRQRDFQGHFNRVMELIGDAKAVGFEVCLSTVVSHGKLDEMRQITEFARDRGVGIVYSLACPTGNWTGARDELLTPEEYAEVDAYMTANPHIRSDWTINFSMKRECPGGREKLCISPYGDVMGCGMNYISHGNVREEPLEAIWRRTLEWAPFRQRSKTCLIAVNQEYLDEYLIPVTRFDRLPVPIENHPLHPAPAGKGGGERAP